MKKVLISIIAVLLVVILAFGMFACDKDVTPAGDNNNANVTPGGNNGGNNGGENGGENQDNNTNTETGELINVGTVGKVGDVKYAAPTKGNVASAEAANAVKPFIMDIANEYGASISEDDEAWTTVGNIVSAMLNEGGIPLSTLTTYVNSAKTLYDDKVKAIVATMMDSDDIMTDIGSVITKENIQSVMTLMNSGLNAFNANQAIALALFSMGVFTTEVYSDFDFDIAGVNAKLTAKGVDPTEIRSVYYDALSKVLTTDEAVYVARTGLEMAKKLTSYSAEELEQAGKIILKVLNIVLEADDIGSAISANGLTYDGQTVSFKDAIKVVNMAGNIVVNMMSVVNDVELGKALKVFLSDIFALFGGTTESFDMLLGHPELIRLVGNLLKTLDANTVTNIYLDFTDWQSKMDDKSATEADQTKAFAVMVGGIVNFVKGQYSKLSVEAKTDVCTFLGDAELYKKVDELISLIPEDKDTISAENAAKVQELVFGMYESIDISFGYHNNDSATSSSDKYSLQYYRDTPIVGSTSMTKAQLVEKLKTAGAEWYKQGYYKDVDEVDFDFTIDAANHTLTLSGSEINTRKLRFYNQATLRISGNCYDSLYVPIGTNAAGIKSYLEERGTDVSCEFYDTATGELGYLSYTYLRNATYTLSAVDTSKRGDDILIITMTAPYACKIATKIHVYDPSNLVEAGLSISRNQYSYEVGEAWSDSCMEVRIITDNGESRELDRSEYTLSGFDSSKEGRTTVTITYKTFTQKTTFDVVDYSKAVVAGINVWAEDYSISVGDTIEDLGLRVRVYYRGNYNDRYISSGYTVTGFDSSTEGDKTLTVTYQGYTASTWYYVY